MLSWVEIKRSAIECNLKSFRDLIGPSVLLVPVVKSNAYGHGILEVAHICDNTLEADRLAVVSLDEALLLRAGGIKKPIQVLSFFPLEEGAVIESLKNNIILPIFCLEQARLINRVGERLGMVGTAHLKIDTGTTRVGVVIQYLDAFISEVKKFTHLHLEGIWSHFSSSETNSFITKKQLSILMQADETMKNHGICVPLRHIACTAASLLHPTSRLDAVRIGLGTYGLYPASNCQKLIKLQPVLSWKSTIIQLKKVKKGVKISYGGTYTMKNGGIIGVIPIGYYDGYDRAWSNKATVIINGQRCPIRGRVCMNLMMVEVKKGNNARAGDQVTLIGQDNNEEIVVDELAKLTPDTVNYEITTRINPLIPRIMV